MAQEYKKTDFIKMEKPKNPTTPGTKVESFCAPPLSLIYPECAQNRGGPN